MDLKLKSLSSLNSKESLDASSPCWRSWVETRYCRCITISPHHRSPLWANRERDVLSKVICIPFILRYAVSIICACAVDHHVLF